MVEIKSDITKTITNGALFTATVTVPAEEPEFEDFDVEFEVSVEQVEGKEPMYEINFIDLTNPFCREEIEALFATLGQALQWKPE
jgi:hypothetical protein